MQNLSRFRDASIHGYCALRSGDVISRNVRRETSDSNAVDVRVVRLHAEHRDAHPYERNEARRANPGEPTTSTFAVESSMTLCEQ